MSSRFYALALLIFVTACGGSGGSLRNLDDACSIASQRPNYIRAMERAQNKWGVPVAAQMAVIWQESKFKGEARTPVQYTLGVIPMGRQSSAFGYSQALDATWEEYQRDEGGRGARRDNINDATDFIGWYMDQSRQKLGISMTDVRSQYLAYHEGPTGFKRGSYKRKSWLLSIANEVSRRATMYDRQLRTCGMV